MSILVFLSQLFSYSILTWAAFVVVIFVVARFGRLPGLLLGQIIVACVVAYLDIAWVENQMRASDWNGTPDIDIIFDFGLVARIVLINAFLLPVAFVAFRLRKRNIESMSKQDGNFAKSSG
jgi:hypothetical protein